jgi:hypothetical protein
MSEAIRAGTRPLRVVPAACLLAICLLGACDERIAPGNATTPATAPAPATLGCLPGTLEALPLPLDEGFALALRPSQTGPAPARCVLALFGPRTLKSPLAFDRGYARVFGHHEEDGTASLAGLEPAQLQLYRIGATGAAAVWLVRADIGTELEPAHRDVLFTTDVDGTTLPDHLLVGAGGLLYRRDYGIASPREFTIDEESGRGPEPGPRYRARYRIGEDGRFGLVASEILPAADPHDP